MVKQTSFPFGDLCVEDVDTQAFDDPAKPVEPYFSRLSNRKAAPLIDGEEAVIAIRNGQLPVFASAAEVNRPDAFGLTPLAWASLRGSRDLVVKLLEKGADSWAGARCVVPPGQVGDIFYDDTFFTPLALAAHAGRSDIVDLMLNSRPYKQCPVRTGDTTLNGAELQLMLSMGRKLGKDPGHRRLFGYALNRVLAAPEAFRQEGSFEELIKHARAFDFSDAFRVLGAEDAARNRKALLAMAARGEIDDLRYWVNRFNVRHNDELAELLHDVTRDMTFVCSESDKCGRDGDLKLEWILDRIGRPKNRENNLYIQKVFGDGLGPLTRHPKLRFIFERLVESGFQFNLSEKDCTLIMKALSYSYRDECSTSFTSPEFAALLLEQKVDLTQRTPSGLTALDLAVRRATDGPYPEAFAPIAAELRMRGVPYTNRPKPER